MKPKVVLTHLAFPETVAMLEAVAEVLPNLTEKTLPREEVLRRCADADAVMGFMPDSVDAEFLDQCPRLKIVAAALKGYDNYDAAACTERSIWLSIVPDLLTIPTAELSIALMLGVARHVMAGDLHVRSGEFAGWRPTLYGTGLAGSTVGIIGMGRVGRAIAQRLSGFDVQVLYADDQRLDEQSERRWNARQVTQDELLAASDFVIPMLPLTDRTLHLIDHRAIAKMKRGAYLVSTGRGSVVDESAVAAALAGGQLAGYAADVFEMEDWQRRDRPRSVHPELLANPSKTLFTPHLGSAVSDVRREIERFAAEDIVRVLRGERPQGAVNEVGLALER